MSKRYFNVVNPDDVVAKYGADCFRMYEMFLGPIEDAKPWNTKGIDGVSRFLRKFRALFYTEAGSWAVTDEQPSREELRVLHATIKKVSEDIERFSFNTCISAFMVATNELGRLGCRKRAVLRELVVVMAPFAPFLSEELWHALGEADSVHRASFPAFDPTYLQADTITYPIALNGKTRLTVDFPATATPAELEAAVRSMEALAKYLEGKSVKKVIVVPGRMINVVVG
jgi:leucyl-tRNA synthetase